MYSIRNITDDILYVGAEDLKQTSFEGHYTTPDGMAYNSYLLRDEKTVLFDTADRAVAEIFLANVDKALDGRALDYVVVHHMEPDHSATLDAVLTRYPDAGILCSAQAAKMIANFTGSDYTARIRTVKEGDTLEAGRHTLRFIAAPMIHWPEVMMTYDAFDRVLFSADAFGTFGSRGGALFDDETDFDARLDEAARYYLNIVGKYGVQVQNVLKKAAALDVALICPLHGFVLRSRIADAIAKYDVWSSYKPEIDGVCVIYASVYGHTAAAAHALANALRKRGVATDVLDVTNADKSYALAKAFRYSHSCFAATTYNAGVFVAMEELLADLKAHGFKNRKYALMENGSWAPMSGKLMDASLAAMPGMTKVGDTVTMLSAPNTQTLDAIEKLADALSESVGG